jgi:hypothetical protein
MTPYEMALLVNSPAFRPHREKAVRLMADLWEPGLTFDDKWYRDMRTETVALLLHFGKLQEPGAATGSKPDPRLAAIEAKWPGLVAKLAG